MVVVGASDEGVERFKEMLTDSGFIPFLLDRGTTVGRREHAGYHNSPIFLTKKSHNYSSVYFLVAVVKIVLNWCNIFSIEAELKSLLINKSQWNFWILENNNSNDTDFLIDI